MNCPSCGAPMRLKPDMESFRCDYCQSVYFPEKNDDGVRVLDEPSGQNCPLCNIPLVHAAIAKVRIIYCTGCHGMLVSMPVFEVLVEELQADAGGRASTGCAHAQSPHHLLHRMPRHVVFNAGI